MATAIGKAEASFFSDSGSHQTVTPAASWCAPRNPRLIVRVITQSSRAISFGVDDPQTDSCSILNSLAACLGVTFCFALCEREKSPGFGYQSIVSLNSRPLSEPLESSRRVAATSSTVRLDGRIHFTVNSRPLFGKAH